MSALTLNVWKGEFVNYLFIFYQNGAQLIRFCANRTIAISHQGWGNRNRL